MSTDRDELDRLAGEYVLGLLEDSERSAFEDALSQDATTRRALRHARERFLDLDIAVVASKPPPELWNRIEAALDDDPDEVLPQGERGAVHDFPVKPRTRFWSGFAAASAAAVVLALLGIGTFRALLVQPEPQLVVVLLNAEAQPEALVEAYADSNDVRIVPLQALEAPGGKSLQVWTLPDPATGPVSLGLIEESGAITLSNGDLPPPRPDQLYEITIENAGGSPTGRPTGPILAKGFARTPQI